MAPIRGSDIPLPPGISLGDRIKTNARYAQAHKRAPGPFVGTIIGGSRSCDGQTIVQFDHRSWPCGMPVNEFEVVRDDGEA